jgi:RES domain-containing protein
MASSAKGKSRSIRVWRITRAKTITKAFDGEGAWQYGGRWNLEGHRAVYTAENISLCALEILVHLDPEDMPSDYYCFEVKIPTGLLVERIDASTLTKNWRSYPPPAELQRIGTNWLVKKTSAVLSVPSAVIPEERVFVLNPEHKEFGKIHIIGPKPFVLDPRLIQ